MAAVPDTTTGTGAIAAPSTMPSSLDQTPTVDAESGARTTITEAATAKCGTTPPFPDQPQEPATDKAGPSTQRATKVYASTAEAIANFKPTPREVISGIAPHVFDERKRRRSQKRTSKPYWYELSGQPRSSPLRGATVISWDEHSIYLEQVEQSDHKKLPSSDKTESSSTSSSGSDTHAREADTPDNAQRGAVSKRRVKLDKAGWKHFRVDIHLFRSLGVKLRLSTPSIKTKTKP